MSKYLNTFILIKRTAKDVVSGSRELKDFYEDACILWLVLSHNGGR